MAAELIHGCCLEQMAAMKAAGRAFDSIVTDPPYGLNFMNRHWDAPDNIAFRPETWRLAYDLLAPGAMLAAFGGARTQHRIACAIEDAGFTIFDCALWLHGQGFPKGKTQLKPAYEPIILARKQIKGPLRHLAIDACRVATDENQSRPRGTFPHSDDAWGNGRPDEVSESHPAGRWPANILHDGSPEVLAAFARFGVKTSGVKRGGGYGRDGGSWAENSAGGMFGNGGKDGTACYADAGSAARYFPALGFSDDELRFAYCAKASRRERGEGNTHSTVKPLALMRWLTRLITPPGGAVLDMFAGSGTTALACAREGFDCVLIERELEYCQMISKRLGLTFELEAAD